MEWFKDLYDQFRMDTNFGKVSDKDTKADVDFICEVLELDKDNKVLDLFCGFGRHSIELSKRGYSATAIDYNRSYLEFGKKLCEGMDNTPNFVQGDVRSINYGDNYDAAIIMFNSFGYFNDNEDKLILGKIYNALKPKGKFLIEILNRDWILKNYKDKQESEFGSIKVIEKREFDILTSRNNFIIERSEENRIVSKKGSWRLYSPHEIKNVLEGIGFHLVNAYSNLSKDPISIDTRLMRMIFVK
jgi:SAM-dependent methyltransferase